MKFTSRLIVQTKKFKCFADSISREFKHRQARQTRENLPPSIHSRDPQRAPSHEFRLQYPARLAPEGATGQNRCRPSGSRGLAPMNLLGVRGDQIESDWPTIIGLKSAPPLRVARATEREIECKKSLSKLLSLSLSGRSSRLRGLQRRSISWETDRSGCKTRVENCFSHPSSSEP